MDQLSGLNIYIYTFDNFKHEEIGSNGLRTTVIEDGDKNNLNFRFGDQEYDFTFYLSSYEQYLALFQIIGSWQQAGIELKARSAFEDEYIRQQMIDYGYGAHLGSSANSR